MQEEEERHLLKSFHAKVLLEPLRAPTQGQSCEPRRNHWVPPWFRQSKATPQGKLQQPVVFPLPPLPKCFVRIHEKHSRFYWYLHYQQSGCFSSLLTTYIQCNRLKRPPDSKPCNDSPLPSFLLHSFSLMAFTEGKR